MRLAFVVQRYGLDIAGGAEYHCRLIAEHLARRARVEVITTCARDYVTWANHYPRGEETLNGVPVWRFAVDAAHALPARAVLVPTAEDDGVYHLPIYPRSSARPARLSTTARKSGR